VLADARDLDAIGVSAIGRARIWIECINIKSRAKLRAIFYVVILRYGDNGPVDGGDFIRSAHFFTRA
jgi:hypothetical protein